MIKLIKALRREDANRMDMLRERLAAADAISALQTEVERLQEQCRIYRESTQEAWATARRAEARIKELEAALLPLLPYDWGAGAILEKDVREMGADNGGS